MNKEDTPIKVDKLPKYAPGQAIIAQGEFAILSGTIKSSVYSDGEWMYFIDTRSDLPGIKESKILYLFNAGYWVHVEYWQPCKEYDPQEIEKDMYESMLEEDPEETAFIEEQKKIFKETQALREETDSDEAKTKIEVQEES